MTVTIMDVCKIFWAIFLPPLAVFLEKGCGSALVLNIILTLLGWLPGQIHAFCVILHCIEDDTVPQAPDNPNPAPPPAAPAPRV
jgi:uncharacterized membrane protein YqaE (UPF0057 family)